MSKALVFVPKKCHYNHKFNQTWILKHWIIVIVFMDILASHCINGGSGTAMPDENGKCISKSPFIIPHSFIVLYITQLFSLLIN